MAAGARLRGSGDSGRDCLSEHTWSSEAGAHGPLVLCTAAWLIWRQSGEIRAQGVQGRAGSWLPLRLSRWLLFIVGEAFDVITLEAAGLYGMGVTIFYSCFGWTQIVRNWFIFLYLLFAVPPPRSWLDALTFPLKQFVSSAATAILRPSGFRRRMKA